MVLVFIVSQLKWQILLKRKVGNGVPLKIQKHITGSNEYKERKGNLGCEEFLNQEVCDIMELSTIPLKCQQ